ISNNASLSKELPLVVKSLREGWLQTLQSGAVVSALLAATAAQLLGNFKSSLGMDSSASAEAVLIFCYLSLFFNISATTSTFYLIDRLGELTFLCQDVVEGPRANKTSSQLLYQYKIGKFWYPIMWFWAFCTLLGISCTLVTIVIFIWKQESKAVSVTVTVLAGLAF
ncbi:hypothetical protein BDQ12DRAFT_563847, partial [Crucibulum laeve]